MSTPNPCFPSAFIPYRIWGGSWFPAWHTSPLAEVDIGRFAAESFAVVMSQRNFRISELDYLITGSTIPWLHKFWGSPYLSHIFGRRVPGFHIEQACATGLQAIVKACSQVQSGSHDTVGVLAFDKTSNSPASVFPNQGSYRRTEALSDVWDNFGYDPATGASGFSAAKGETSMIACAGRAFRKRKLDWREVAELAFYRYMQYAESKRSGLFDDWLLPLTVIDQRGKRVGVVDEDTGIRSYSSAEEIAAERQLEPGVSPGTQTHASDGMFGMAVTSRSRAAEFSADPKIEIQLIAAAEARADAGFMPEAPAIAVKKLLNKTGLTIGQISTLYCHNPFAVNDVIFAHEFDHDWRNMNDTGCPLVYGHPQGPTLVRVTVEALETTVRRGGGYALIFGCAAGDVGIAALFSVIDKRKGS